MVRPIKMDYVHMACFDGVRLSTMCRPEFAPVAWTVTSTKEHVTCPKCIKEQKALERLYNGR